LNARAFCSVSARIVRDSEHAIFHLSVCFRDDLRAHGVERYCTGLITSET
jgi:hypothetical protein